jgi:dipeptidyl aminopeptidase/acylaminoacyl peptidase
MKWAGRLPGRIIGCACRLLLRGGMPLLIALHYVAALSTPLQSALVVDNYFQLKRISELAVSPNGEWMVYVVVSPSIEQDQLLRHVYLAETDAHGDPMMLDGVSDGHDFAWDPATQRLLFLSDRSGSTQVFSSDRRGKNVIQVTDSPDPVVRFLSSSTHTLLAYITKARYDAGTSLYKLLRTDGPGIEVDPNATSIYDFIDPNHNGDIAKIEGETVLWIKVASAGAVPIAVPGNVQKFFWSDDAKYLSVSYAPHELSHVGFQRWRTSIGLVESRTHRFRTLEGAIAPRDSVPGTWFIGGEWIPNTDKVLVRRITETDPWVSREFPQWAVEDVNTHLRNETYSWTAAESYGDDNYGYFPLTASTVLVEETVEGRRSLFKWKKDERRPSAAVTLSGTNSLFSFTTDRKRVVFVHEDLVTPPEIYLENGLGEVAHQISSLNAELANIERPIARKVQWSSLDGTTVNGWLLLPSDSSAIGPLPLITFVHGGPTYVYPDAFAPYFDRWPAPLEVYAIHGMAVFIPNYRGTATYGRKFQTPTELDAEPVDDIVSGISQLIHDGVANPTKLGLSGHSHGAWLGPMVMNRMRAIRASSFAEGIANMMVNYDLMPGRLDREILDPELGGSIYDSPERYLRMSPELHFNDVVSANLFEGGSQSLAVQMLDFAKASVYRGLPTELIIYPNTAHNIVRPQIQKESAQRNVDWFRFWLLDQEDPTPQKSDQYARWRAMKVTRISLEHAGAAK